MTRVRAALAAALLLLPGCGDTHGSSPAGGSGGKPALPETCGPAGAPSSDMPDPSNDHAGAGGDAAGGASGEGSPGACVIGALDAPLGFPSMTADFAATFSATSIGRQVKLVDLDRDGRLDVVVGASTEDYVDGSSYVATLLGNGDGTFRVVEDVVTSASAYSLIAAGDLNRDGFPDVVSVARLTGSAQLFLGAGDGTLVTGPELTLPRPDSQVIDSLELRDFDRDGTLDIVTEFAVLLGHGDGTFDDPSENPGGILADLDGDHRPDGALVTDKGLTIRRRLCDGGFGAPVMYPVGHSAVADWLLADLDGDGVLDLVATSFDGELELLRGAGDGTFGSAESVASDPALASTQGIVSPAYGSTLLAIDANEDGIVDLLLVRNDVLLLPGLGGGAFGPIQTLRAGSIAESVAAGELNGDGHLDLLVGDWTYDPGSAVDVSVLLGKASGGYPEVHRIVENVSQLGTVVAGDLNGDGLPDLCETWLEDNGFNTVHVQLGVEGGGVGDATAYPVPPVSRAAKLADVDGDGKLDWLAPSCTGDGVSVLLGLGDGTFPLGSPLPVKVCEDMNVEGSLDVGDLDHDGRLDVVLSNPKLGAVSVLRGDGAGGFATPENFPLNLSPFAVVVRDLNGDGKLDVATADTSGNLAVVLGDGQGSLGKPITTLLPGKLLALSAGDFNGDGQLDLAVVRQDTDDVAILLGHGDGLFDTAQTYGVDRFPTSLAVGDLNGDGQLDLVSGNVISVSVLYGGGDGTFGHTESYGARGGGPNVQLLELNGDGRPDVLLPSEFGWIDELFATTPRTCR